MPISVTQSILIILICAACTALERFLPFLVFREGRTPAIVGYLGKILPMAIMATLVIYCLRGTTFTSFSGFLPQLIAVAVTVLFHLWRRNTLLSVLGGTVAHMCLVQFVFV
ncbi:MAG: AzlD domain-containing protein [Clostridia bacterium]|nr:AzlD domain-containing protein [Clostridia bacterium]